MATTSQPYLLSFLPSPPDESPDAVPIVSRSHHGLGCSGLSDLPFADSETILFAKVKHGSECAHDLYSQGNVAGSQKGFIGWSPDVSPSSSVSSPDDKALHCNCKKSKCLKL